VCQLSIYNSFPVIRATIAKKSSFLRTPALIFCLPWGRTCGNHAKRCLNEKTIQCLSNPSQHLPIYLQQFSSYSNRKCKKSPFSRTAAYIFVSPENAPAIITQYVAWMKRQFNACQTPRSMSIFNSFRVIRCLSQCLSPKIAIFTTFLFLAACAHLTITVSKIQRDICRKSSFFHSPLHSTPPLGGFPSAPPRLV